jgi:iron only hydrogenase large subunit-like protein
VVAVSISSQARASIGGKYGFHQQKVFVTNQIWQKLQHFLLERLKIDYVFDVDFARDFALLESAKQFVSRYQDQRNLPMLASSCPGWICYAEKTHSSILHLIDSTKSPQQIMGSLVKNYMSEKLGLKPSDIYHVSIMPCYDKKLEASRQDFYNDVYKTRDVDLVLSTAELEHVILSEKIDIPTIPEVEYRSQFMKGDGIHLVGTEGSSSGGYLSFILRYAVYHLFGINLTWHDIQCGANGITIIPGRNADFTEIRYQPPNSSEPVLRFAYAYGFRNIQNMVRKAKRPTKKQEFHFVEIMACPSGCINGGGQLKAPTESLQALKEWTNSSQQSYEFGENLLGPESNQLIHSLYANWLNSEELIKKFLHTEYHAVENSVSGLSVNW